MLNEKFAAASCLVARKEFFIGGICIVFECALFFASCLVHCIVQRSVSCFEVLFAQEMIWLHHLHLQRDPGGQTMIGASTSSSSGATTSGVASGDFLEEQL